MDFAGRPVPERLVSAMCAAIRHRGPDEEGVKTFPGDGAARRASVGLGSRRLAIIDVAGGQQPIPNEDQTVWVVFNGEIYNFPELRARLEARGHHLATHSDTEVIVHLWEDLGEDFVAELDGMFALALWDDRTETLVLARDRFGKKPLLYADRGGRLTFGSEFSSVLLDEGISRERDPIALDYYLTYMAVPAPHTIYKGIRKVPPAHLLVANRDGIRLRRYWSLDYQPKQTITEADALDRIRELFTEAVRKRLISEVPLGAFLSGGVDSSAVVAVMAKLSSRPVKTFSIGFDEQRFNELPHARRVAELFHTEHHEFVVQPHAMDVLPILVRHFGEPFADSSAIPSYYLAKMTREHVTVALNGDGGDEMFAGYTRHLGHYYAEQWQRMPQPIVSLAEWIGRSAIPRGPDARRFAPRFARFLQSAAWPRPERYESWAGMFSGDLKAQLLATRLSDQSNQIVRDILSRGDVSDAVDAGVAVDTFFYLPTDLLVKMDIMTMANSLEARSPLLDHHLAEFVATLPSSFKVKGRTTKYLLKKAFDGILPAENLYRGKMGFSIPLADWFRGELREMLMDNLLSPRSLQRGLFRKPEVERLIATHVAGTADYSHHLWVLLMLELWHREFVDGDGSVASDAVA